VLFGDLRISRQKPLFNNQKFVSNRFTNATDSFQQTLLPPQAQCIVKVIEMEKTKIVILATAIAVLALLVVVGAAYAQTSLPSQTPQTSVPTGACNGANGNGCYTCPNLNGYSCGAAQNGYAGQRGACLGGGIKGCCNR
jgi:hypothetical protein